MEQAPTLKHLQYVFLVVCLASLSTAQTTKTNIFFPIAGWDQVPWSGSVIGACADSTTYALQCSGTPTYSQSALPSGVAASGYASLVLSGIQSVVTNMCDESYTITKGPSGFVSTDTVTYTLETLGVTAVGEGVGTLSCDLAGTTSASCALTQVETVSAAGQSTTSTYTTSATLTGTEIAMPEVTLTAGVQKLAKATDSACPNGAAGQTIPVILGGLALFVGTAVVVML